MFRLAIVLALLGCGRKSERATGSAGSGVAPGSGSAGSASGSGSAAPTSGTVPAAVASSGAPACALLPFAQSTPVHEASGAAWMTIDGALGLVVISDSGNDGEYAIVDPETGKTGELGKLPLGGAGDDLEGVAVRGGKLVAVTSAGWIRVWDRKGKGFALVEGPYAIGPVTLPDKPNNLNHAHPGDGMACKGEGTNCARNYEGLCLAPEPVTGRCVGFVAAKADGALYCLVDRDGTLVAERGGAIAVARPGTIADCAFTDDGRLFVGSNMFDLGKVFRIDGWQDPASAKIVAIADLAIGFPETLAARGEVIYRMSDTGSAPSLMAKYRCTR